MALSDGLTGFGDPGVGRDPGGLARRAPKGRQGGVLWSQEIALKSPIFPSGIAEESRSVLAYDEAALCEALPPHQSEKASDAMRPGICCI